MNRIFFTGMLLLLCGACRQAPLPPANSYVFPSPNTVPDSILKTIQRLKATLNSTPQEKALASIYQGLYYSRVSAYRQSWSAFTDARLQLKGVSDPTLQSEIYKGLGNAAKDLGEYPEALRMFSTGLRYCTADSEDQAGIHANIAQVFQLQEDLPQAEIHLQQALKLSGEKKGNIPYLVVVHTLANVYGMQGKIDSALLLDAEGLLIARRIGASGYQTSFLDNKANCFVFQNRPDSARHYFRQCLAIDSRLGNKKQVSDTWLNLGLLEQLQHNLPLAEEHLKRSIKLANAVGYRKGAMTGWQALTELYTEKEDYPAALRAQTASYKIKDSLLSEKKAAAIAEWKAIYETQKKEEEIRLQTLQLRQKNLIIGFGSLSAALLLSAVYFANRRAKLRKEKRYQEELFAHDQESALKILIAEEGERRRIAADLHDGVGQTLTAAWLNLQATQPLLETLDAGSARLLHTTTQLIGDSCSEIRQISHNMMPTVLFQKGLLAALEEMISLISEKQLKVSLSADALEPPLDKTTELVLYRIIQECVSNVVRHAGATHLYISIHKEEALLSVMIEDNGRGMGGRSLEATAGIGLENIRSRVQYLRGTVEWNPVNEDQSGTIVEIYIPSLYVPAP